MADAVTVDLHRQRVAAHMAGGRALAPLAYMAFGDGGHNADLTAKPPSQSATALFHEVFRKPLASVTQEDIYSSTGKGIVESGELIGVAVSEVGLIDADGELVSIKTFGPKVKESDERYEISVKQRY